MMKALYTQPLSKFFSEFLANYSTPFEGLKNSKLPLAENLAWVSKQEQFLL